MIAALHGAIDEAGRDAGVRAVVIAAKGPAFCAGHDLKELTRAARAMPTAGAPTTPRSCAAAPT